MVGDVYYICVPTAGYSIRELEWKEIICSIRNSTWCFSLSAHVVAHYTGQSDRLMVDYALSSLVRFFRSHSSRHASTPISPSISDSFQICPTGPALPAARAIPCLCLPTSRTPNLHTCTYRQRGKRSPCVGSCSELGPARKPRARSRCCSETWRRGRAPGGSVQTKLLAQSRGLDL